ncbi:MAG TPA: TQO small subunit DoxD [Gaiellales bacterium]
MSRQTTPSITPGMALLPVRLFLGVTFVYAGWQKLSDPGFLTPGSATYIGTQLHAFASGTPGGFLLRWFALPYPRAAGVGVALTEIAIGLMTTAGLLTRLAAAAGLGLNLILFLTASWTTTPYFLGSDIVFCFAWLPLLLVGAAEQPAVDTLLLARRRTSDRPGRQTRPGATVYGAGGVDPHTRQTLLRRALVATGAATLSIGALATALRGSAHATAAIRTLGGGATSTPGTHRTTPKHHRKNQQGTTGGTTTQTSGGLPNGAVRLGPSSAVRADAATIYRDPSDGSPDILIRHGDGSLAAFSAVCTHAGCQVGYGSGVIACPCHGSEFSASTGAVLRGPAVTPLATKRVVERSGSIYAV